LEGVHKRDRDDLANARRAAEGYIAFFEKNYNEWCNINIYATTGLGCWLSSQHKIEPTVEIADMRALNSAQRLSAKKFMESRHLAYHCSIGLSNRMMFFFRHPNSRKCHVSGRKNEIRMRMHKNRKGVIDSWPALC
jgi:hypothetical protein